MPQLIETTLWESAQAPAAGVIADVKILGQRSKNKRLYTEQAMQGAVSLYEGKAVYVNHSADKHRSAQERFGRLKNVRFDAQRKELRGDLVYLESQAQVTAMIKEDLARGLNFFGLSHSAHGQSHMKEDILVVTKIDRVQSVDLVSDPATATSLKEQEDAAPAAEPSVSDQAMSDAFSQAVLAVLQDTALDTAGKAAKIKLILEKQEEINTPPQDGEKKDEPAKEQTDPTVAALQEQIANLTKTVAAMAKPRKYVTAQAGASMPLTEQAQAAPVDAPPKDKAALKKWLLAK